MTEPIEVDKHWLGPLRRIGSGGQGTVYELVDRNNLVYKEYSPRVASGADLDTLVRFVEFERGLPPEDRRQLTSRAAWPQYVVRDNDVVHGFVMARAPDEFQVTMAWPGGEREAVLGQVQFLLNDNDYLEARDLHVTAEFRLAFLRDVVTTLDLFHRLGITVGDLSPNNLLFSMPDPRCYFLDCDAMSLNTSTILDQVETPDWRVSDLGDEPLATTSSDNHKLALLAIRLFAGDQHTRDTHVLPKRLRHLATRALDRDPANRPPPRDWAEPIDLALRNTNTEPPPTPKRPRRPKAPIRQPAPAQVRTARRFRLRRFAGTATVIGLALFGFLMNTNSNTSTSNQPGPSAIPPPAVFSYTASIPSIPSIPSFAPPTIVLDCLPMTITGANVPADDKVVGAIDKFTCSLSKGGTDPQFNDLVPHAPLFGRTVTSVTKAANGTLRVTLRFLNLAEPTRCMRTTLTLSPVDGGYAVSGATKPAAAPGCG
ncbi:hypothetical protein ACFQ1S_03785 [Kibdelosporangium lantanae]|uniref:Protein kinase domain-containing protein n=1 Tax=Kibdelosporangium lantanae TaxID=1497396 RepID=A0ABW3M2J6_9PSEU